MLKSKLGPATMLLILCIAGSALASDTTPLFEGLGDFHRAVSTQSQKAQRYFDQGMVLYFGFNHEEALNSFQTAAALDPSCAMAYWGSALALGPNINNPEMDENAVKGAYESLTQALAHSAEASTVERALIQALAQRYVESAPEDRSALDLAYANAMREVWKAHPEDPDVGVLFAESMMDLRPWDLFDSEGEMQPGTEEIISTLETILAAHPGHPFANHLYIHTMEASKEPERALPSADRLRDMVPAAGHLVHMPGHIYMRLGRYGDVITANQKAIAADSRYVDLVGRHGFYTLYRAHNYHFLAYAAMFDGQKKLAMNAARNMVAEVPLELVRAFPDFLDSFIAVPIHVMVRFGMWKELLEEPAPPEDLQVCTATWHYGRTIALSVLGRVDEAGREMNEFEKALDAIPESRLVGNNTAKLVMEIGRNMAQGELEYRRGNYERAFELLREAVRRDDELRYDEPWGWMQPARHALGALLVEQKRYEEAEVVYRGDLKLHPDNGWSLHGLAECLRNTGRGKEAMKVDAKYRKSWARSDIMIKGSCFCRTKS